MSTLVIKNFPDELHALLKARAQAQHRSMTGEAIALLESALNGEDIVREAPVPYRGASPLTRKMIDSAKRSGRA